MSADLLKVQDLNVLLVEDDAEIMELCKDTLRELGLTAVHAASDGIEALEMFEALQGEDTVDVVLCDWNMPRMSGLDLLKEIRGRDPNLLFIVMSGRTDSHSVAEAKNYGVAAHLEKPFSTEKLASKLNVMSRVIHSRKNGTT
jgi:two-component system chemotaxis response regulator CheY